MHLMRYALLLCAVVLGLENGNVIQAQAASSAQPADQQVREDAAQYLGDRFTSRSAGISFRPPLYGQEIKPPVVGTTIVQYLNSEEKWALRVSQMIFEQPMRLVGRDDPTTLGVDEAKSQPGVLGQTAQQVTLQHPGCQILRQDVINVETFDTGLLVLRYTQGTQTYLRQMALLQRNDQHYYVFDLTSPSRRTSDDPEHVEDPSEVLAVRIFRAILDSVQVLDMRAIQLENDQRLYRSRTLLVNIPKRLQEALPSEQFFRIQRKGKDMGWSYVVEEFGQRLGEAGIYVATRSHGMTEPGTTVETASEMFCADGRKGEAWVTITVADKNGNKEHISEFGQSDKRTVRVVEQPPKGAPTNQEPTIRLVERYQLNVTQANKTVPANIARELPPYYLPQALSHLLPRLVPLNETKGYLFLVWVSNSRELVHRYIDVEGERSVTFGGQKIRAVVVKDRLGLEGEPTYHYFTAKGRYLGYEVPSADLVGIATDQQTIEKLWPDAKLERPRVLDAPAGT